MTKSQGDDFARGVEELLAPDTAPQVTCDVDGIIAGLDYDSFELLPGTVNARPGMKFVAEEPLSDDSYPLASDFTMEDSVGVPPMYFYPSPAPYWPSPFLMSSPGRIEGKKKKKNKKKRNKNRQRQLQLQLEREMSPSTTPDFSDGSTDSPVHSPLNQSISSDRQSPVPGEVSLDKKTKKKRNKQRRRGSGRRRSGSPVYPAYDGIDMMSVHLNGLNLSGGLYPKPGTESYPMRSGPNYSLNGTVFSRGSPLWVPHPIPIYGQC